MAPKSPGLIWKCEVMPPIVATMLIRRTRDRGKQGGITPGMLTGCSARSALAEPTVQIGAYLLDISLSLCAT